MSMRLIVAFFVLTLALPAGARAQQESTSAAAPETQAVLPAEALTYAAELEKQAAPKLLEWAKKHARNLLRDEFTADELTAESIAQLFPAQPTAAREAIRFLVGYQVYRRASDRQESRAASLRDLDRDIADLDHRIRMVEGTGAPIGSIAAENRRGNLAEGQRRMDLLHIQRKLAVSSEEVERKRVDTVLRWLADAHPAVKDTPAGVLRSVTPPRS